MSQPAKCIKTHHWMLVIWFWSNTVIQQQKQEHYMNVQTDPLDKQLTIRPIETGWEVSNELYPNWHARLLDVTGWVFGDCSVPTPTWTQCASLESLLTPVRSLLYTDLWKQSILYTLHRQLHKVHIHIAAPKQERQDLHLPLPVISEPSRQSGIQDQEIPLQ